MITRRKQNYQEYETAVSPVVGVMLMLVVTIIIAAVVSGFAGGLFGAGSNQKTPALAMDVKIQNSTDGGLSFSANVLSISEPVSTSKLKISTSWVKNATVYGGAETTSKVPYGFGPGVTGDVSLTKPYNQNQWFGNYSLMQGTGMLAEPGDISSILGSKYANLKPGDTVNVRVFYIPTGKAVFQKDVIITGV
ncbi:MAG: type IV pilin [Methanomicrobiales archaeon]|nr:type IV pilin [Methanomicrobiales archaeon]